jgi:RND superfamily putative drug exporter
MENHVFYKLGNLIYPLRWYLIVAWLIITLACVPFLAISIAPFKTTGFSDENSASAKAEQYLNNQLGYNNANKFLLIYQSTNLSATNPAYIRKIKQSLSELKKFPIETEIILPSDNKNQISKDKRTAYVVVTVKDHEILDAKLLEQFTKAIKTPTNMSIEIGGEAIFIQDVNKQTQLDLYKADKIATPIALITMLLVFGSLIAALLPLFLGGSCALVILSSLFALGHIWIMSIFTLNIALLLGLCLSLDYSLFIISRFREELHNGITLRQAIAITEETAGKAIFFSGVAVLVSLSALFLFPVNILFSVAMGGVTAVLVAVITAIIILPAILTVLNTRINWFSVRFLQKNQSRRRLHAWHWLAAHVVRRPLLVFLPVLFLLLMLGYPLLSAKFGISDHRIFPEESENRQFFSTYAEKFDINELTPIWLLVQSPNQILSRNNISKIYNLVQKLKDNPSIKRVDGLISSTSDLSKKQYSTLYTGPKKYLSSSVKKLLAATTKKSFTTINVISHYDANSEQTAQLVDNLKTIKKPSGLTIKLSGTPVINIDVLQKISDILPFALLWIIVFTYLILLILLRSLLLPVKAIIMNLLSLSACYGALVLVFQDGYLSPLLNFEPQGMLDISLLVIIFCAIFGFSMDYEVFLLTRIKEAYESTNNNKKSIIFGIERSSRIITSAALIVIVICASFLVADVLMVKAFGLGIAVAIFVDAFLIRTLLVPSTMALLEKWNWYLPRWLDRLLPKL